jgi:spore germination protein KA
MTHENLTAIFAGAGDFEVRQVLVGKAQLVRIYAIDGLVSGSEISDFVVKPLMGAETTLTARRAVEMVVYHGVARVLKDLDEAAEKLVNGFCVVLFGPGDGAAFEVKTGEKRSISGPEVENTVKGAKDAFTETVRTNTSLLRRHLRSPKLRLEEQTVGRQSLTNVTICSLEGITDRRLVEAVSQRLQSIDVDGLLTPAAVEEYLTGSRRTAFPLLIYTERADRFAGGILAGRVGVLADGLPLGYLLPCCLPDFLESPEDRGGNYMVAAAIRVLRGISLLAALLLPGFFAAVSLYHQEMIPTALLRAIVESRQAVPLSTGGEVLLLLVAFELLQEAGLHLPQNLGQAVSIIGGLVVGSGAVEASLISPAALIVVSVAGVCGFTLPHRDFADGVRLWRFAISLGAVVAGLKGMTLVFLLLLLHLGDLRSLGVPYLRPMDQGKLPKLEGRLINRKWRRAWLRPENRRNQR